MLSLKFFLIKNNKNTKKIKPIPIEPKPRPHLKLFLIPNKEAKLGINISPPIKLEECVKKGKNQKNVNPVGIIKNKNDKFNIFLKSNLA
ncbi:unnamed protein product [marine sediment metagenome]|uniref:Uncharacterized protein n=1 Tax=marine sediment metagenome TaxID=412755 RepID=X1LPH3_9ZZZZ